ncbi:MAG: AAA family ATPase [Bacteroidales bacterium]|nr:AAA family ATPase [Bacteroidales bacterium]
MKLFGRKRQIALLKEYENSGRSEFIALYGRRRVGKTYLIDQLYGDSFAFSVTGSIGGPTEEEKSIFKSALRQYDSEYQASPTSWVEILDCLRAFLSRKIKENPGERQIVFLDELPCFDTARSGFVRALEQFWNGWASKQPEIMLIVCGSATSWMVSNIINSHGGLHNRVTHEMHLHQFTLADVEDYLMQNGYDWDRLSIAKLYMAIGGVPYYWSLLNKSDSADSGIDRLFFSKEAPLKEEYQRLYKSLFRNAQQHLAVVNLLAANKHGLSRNEIGKELEMISGGNLTKILQDLEYCDFVKKYRTREKKIKSTEGIYKLVDFFSIFYHAFCTQNTTDEHYWTTSIGTPKQNTWYGLAFERLVQEHVQQVCSKIGVDKIHTEHYAWRTKADAPAKAQIDLVIERADRVANICEIKFSNMPYAITKDEDMKLRNRMAQFQAATGLKYALRLTMITTFGVMEGKYKQGVNTEVVLDDLFATL